MNYAPLFSQIADSSLWEEPYHVRILFVTMMSKKLPDQVVYADEYRLKKWSNLRTLEEVIDALKILSSPDSQRPGQPYEGRRIQKVEGGWFIINGDFYEKMMHKVNERARKARWAREQRSKEREAKARSSDNGKLETGKKDFEDHMKTGRIANDPSVNF